MNIDEYLKSLVIEGVSDIHFKVGRPPLLRIHGMLTPTEAQSLSPNDTEAIASSILGGNILEKLEVRSEFDTSYSIPGFSRFRANIFRQRGTVSIILRTIPFEVPTLESQGLPKIVEDIALMERGLILVTGAAGTGKSSTLAAIVNHINENKRCHIITIEDPIEYLFKDKHSSINQREVGIDTDNFVTAFKAALRQDPDIILVGEMRDMESMEIALKAAETGHLVLSTLHTTDAKDTVARLVDSFPPHQQQQIKLQVASNLNAVISQRLLDKSDGIGRVVAVEVLIVNAAIRGHILAPYQSDKIQEQMEKGKQQYGMQTFDMAILDLLKAGKITVQEALRNATSPNDLKLKMSLD
jgi:twitching motility protein PilT